MFQYARHGAKCMCTGCPGMIATLDASQARTVKMTSKVQATDSDKKLAQPAFGTCLAIPTAPKKCSPNLIMWANIKPDVKVKGKNALLFPNMIPCASGPGLVTMIHPG